MVWTRLELIYIITCKLNDFHFGRWRVSEKQRFDKCIRTLIIVTQFMSRSVEKDNGQLSGANTGTVPPSPKDNEREANEKLALFSIFVPLVISIVFLGIEIIGLHNSSPDSISGDMILPMIIRYLAPSVLSSSIFMLLQQFFLLLPAGFDPKRGVHLFLAVLLFTSSYSAYLAIKQDMIAHIIIFIFLIIFLIDNIFSLSIIKRKVDNWPFSGL